MSKAVLLPLLLLFSAVCFSQDRRTMPSSPNRSNLTVNVVSEDERPVHGMFKIQLMNTAENSLDERVSTDNSGQVMFVNILIGSYRLRVTGIGLVETTTNVFSITIGESQHFEIVRVKRSDNADSQQSGAKAPVSVTMLNVPDKARGEFDKGSEALSKNDLEGAEKHLKAAVAIYPKYAGAINSLGIIAMKRADPAQARGYFETAVAVDPGFPDAFVNLARLDLAIQHYAEGEANLLKALAPNPLNLDALSMLAVAQFSEDKLEEAVATARKVHSMPHEKYAMVHYLAGAALDKQHKRAEAIEEFQTFLDEAPNSPGADKARNALRILRQQK